MSKQKYHHLPILDPEAIKLVDDEVARRQKEDKKTKQHFLTKKYQVVEEIIFQYFGVEGK